MNKKDAGVYIAAYGIALAIILYGVSLIPLLSAFKTELGIIYMIIGFTFALHIRKRIREDK